MLEKFNNKKLFVYNIFWRKKINTIILYWIWIWIEVNDYLNINLKKKKDKLEFRLYIYYDNDNDDDIIILLKRNIRIEMKDEKWIYRFSRYIYTNLDTEDF